MSDKSGYTPLHILVVSGMPTINFSYFPRSLRIYHFSFHGLTSLASQERIPPSLVPQYTQLTEYTITQVMDRTMKFHLNSITAMQAYAKYSFEEIRLMEWRTPELQVQDLGKMLQPNTKWFDSVNMMDLAAAKSDSSVKGLFEDSFHFFINSQDQKQLPPIQPVARKAFPPLKATPFDDKAIKHICARPGIFCPSSYSFYDVLF